MDLKECFERMASFPDIFILIQQKNTNVEEYFKTKFNLQYIPKDFLSFMSVVDGIKLNHFQVFAISEIDKPYSTLTFEHYSNEQIINTYLNNSGVSTDANLFLFATDGKGGRYAFKSGVEKDKIYYIPDDVDIKMVLFDNFTTLIQEKIEEAISENI